MGLVSNMEISLIGKIVKLSNKTQLVGGAAWVGNPPVPQGMEILQKFCRYLENRKAEVVVDVGANAGGWTIAMAMLPNVKRVYSFEPIPELFEVFMENIKLNNLENKIVAKCKAICDKEQSIEFLRAANAAYSHMGNKMIRKHIPTDPVHPIPYKKITVEGTTLDKELCEKIDVIKIDIEGGELFAIRGALNVLNKYKPDIFYEHHAINTQQFGYDPKMTAELLKSVGYNNWVSYNSSPDGTCHDYLVRKL